MKQILISLILIAQCFAETENGSKFDCRIPDNRDWQKGWTEQHKALNAIAKKGDTDFGFIGDAIMQAWSTKGAAVWKTYYGKYKAANFGIDGDQTQHVLWRIENGNFDGIKPMLIVIMIGTNNTSSSTPGEVGQALEGIVKRLQKKVPNTHLLLLGILPRGVKASSKAREHNKKANAAISKLADNKKVHFMDIGEKFLEKDGSLSIAFFDYC